MLLYVVFVCLPLKKQKKFNRKQLSKFLNRIYSQRLTELKEENNILGSCGIVYTGYKTHIHESQVQFSSFLKECVDVSVKGLGNKRKDTGDRRGKREGEI